MEHHPDRNPNDHTAEERFKEAAEAYSVLSDPQKRATYDRFGHQGLSSSGGGFDPNSFADFSDILGDFFGLGDMFGGGGRRRTGPQRGEDLRYDWRLISRMQSSECQPRFRLRGSRPVSIAKVRAPSREAEPRPVRRAAAAARFSISKAFYPSDARAVSAMARARSSRSVARCARAKDTARWTVS